MRGKTAAIMLAVPMIAACSQKQVYENVRQNRLDACELNQPAAVEDCRRDFSMTYEEYRRVLEDSDKYR
jgi:hypothetical protein